MPNIAFYGSHNASYVVEDNGEIIMVLEVERFLNYKYSGIAQYHLPRVSDLVFMAEYIPKWICNKLGIKEFEKCYFLNTDVIIYDLYRLEQFIPAKEYIQKHHHESHANSTFYQSDFKDALVFSFDGGGDDGKFNVYHATRNKGSILVDVVRNPFDGLSTYDLGYPYMIFGHFLGDIQIEDLGMGNLVYPGKIMGLCAYGVVNNDWLPHFIAFYKSDVNGWTKDDRLKTLSEAIEVPFDIDNRLFGELAYNVAATSQRAFEECFLEVADNYVDAYPDVPICLTGGCALNIILNSRVKSKYGRDVFVAPNSNDCGLALGMLLGEMKPQDKVDITYSGLDIFDTDCLLEYINNNHYIITKKSGISDVGDFVFNGGIVGVLRGKSEHGARALGNRSILCNPMFENMKDILNQKVKKREWYRPFAPVVRLEDVAKYFEWEGESRWMCFNVNVRDEYKGVLSAITHVDGTARVQTVTEKQNKWLYDLLTYMNDVCGVGVLLNTSFNVGGKPLLNTVKDAFYILENTQLDGLVIDDVFIKKKK